MGKRQPEDRGQGHRQRLRQRFVEGGLERFTDEEVVEFLLALGTPRRDVKLPARAALGRFGSLAGVLAAPLDKLLEIEGIGPKNALYLKFIHEVAGRYLKTRAREQMPFGSSRATFDYLFHALRDLKREVFKVLFLDRKNRLISDQDLFQGSLTGSAVYPREVMTLALELRAAALIFVHNHPSGDPAPSAEDRRLTRELVWAARLLGIEVLDHIVIGGSQYFSFADEGLIARYRRDLPAGLTEAGQ